MRRKARSTSQRLGWLEFDAAWLVIVAFIASPSSASSAPPSTTQPNTPTSSVPERIVALADAAELERKTIERMLGDSSWPRRAIAAIRLERFTCADSATMLVKLLDDKSWQVRAFAVRGMAHRGIAPPIGFLSTETEPRVFRAALRHGFSIDGGRLGRGVRALAKSSQLKDKMLAVELGAASRDEELLALATSTCKQIILRMGRSEAGGLSSRLAVVTGQTDLHRPLEWQQWLLKQGRRFETRPGLIPKNSSEQNRPLLAELDTEQFTGLENYMQQLGTRQLDLAICLDCTASMYGELAAAQGGIDDFMRFTGDVTASVRVAIVAYRDRREEFETKAWDFTSDIEQARDQLWTLTADGGGDTPESVYDALNLAFTKLTWRPEASKVLVLVGDAPPHVGEGGLCVNLAERAKTEAKLITHVIQVEGKEVKHFPEIAKAGGGRCVTLEDDDRLIAEIAGLTLADRYEEEFAEFFRIYLELCR